MTARIHLELDTDAMHAWLRVLPGESLDAGAVAEALRSAGVVFGIDESALAHVAAHLHDPAFDCGPLAIATGRAMQRAADERCELAVPLGLQSGHRNADGSFDYRDRGLLTPVARGQVVAHCRPPVAGVDGCTVTGRTIPSERSRETGPLFGEGFVHDGEGNVVAARGGVLRQTDGAAITVGDHYVHDGDVDMHSGHLDMVGSLAISGDVTAKFDVQATADVTIAKSVARGTVYAGGSVHVAGGIVGTGGGAVFAELDVHAEHGQGAVIQCGGALHVRKGAVNCRLLARTIHVDGPVRGGELAAEREIVVGEAGARMGGETQLSVAVELARPLRVLFDDHRRERHVADRLAAQVVHTHARAHHDTHASADALVAHIDVLGTIHAGSIVEIGAHRLVLTHPQRHCRFTLDPETQAIRCDPLP